MDKDFRPAGIEASEWQEGFQDTGSGLSCLQCAALVRKSPGDTKRHREWHISLEARLPTHGIH